MHTCMCCRALEHLGTMDTHSWTSLGEFDEFDGGVVIVDLDVIIPGPSYIHVLKLHCCSRYPIILSYHTQW